ncbi:MAG: DMT family transporter [Muribaculaceae bacterium]
MLVHLAAFCCVSMWGLSFVSSKVLLEEGLGTVEIYIYRFTIAYVLMLLISHSRIMAQSARDEGMFALCGICAGSIYFIAENTALQYTLTTNVSLLTSISPLVTALLAGFIYPNERPGKGLLTGSMVAFLGVAMVIFNASATLEIRPLGDLLALGACFSWAVYSLILRRLSANYDVFFITRKTFLYGLVSSLPFLLLEPELHNPITEMCNPRVLWNVLFLAIGASLVSYVLWSLAVKKLGAVSANNYMYFQPVVTMIAAAIVIGEPITPVGVIGCLTIIFGLWLGDWLTRRQAMKLHR